MGGGGGGEGIRGKGMTYKLEEEGDREGWGRRTEVATFSLKRQCL